MKRKTNGKAGSPEIRPRARPGAGDDPGFTATQGSSSRPAADVDETPDRDSGLKQAGLSDVGGTGPRRKPGNGGK
jgi:hypothetical protein